MEKKSKKKTILIVLGVLLLLYVISSIMNIDNVKKEYASKQGINDIKIELAPNEEEFDVLNGTGDKKIGTRLLIKLDRKITEQDIIDIYNKRAKNSDYKWITILQPDGYGCFLHGGADYFNCSNVDMENDAIQTGKADIVGTISNNTIKYHAESKKL